MIDEIIPRVLDNWEKIQPERSRPAQLIPVLQSRNRVVIFLFDAKDRGSSPVVVVKISRSLSDNERLENSTKRLQSVRSLLDPSLRVTVPRTVILERINGLSVVVETVLKGEPIAPRALNSLRPQVSARDCRAFAEWLLAFQWQTVTGHEYITETALAEMLFDPLWRYLEPGRRGQDEAWLKETSKKLIGFAMPFGWRYGDAHPSNILIDGRAVSGVVDWEGAEPVEWPVMDWLHFALMYAIECCKKTHPSWKRADLADHALRLMIYPPTSGVACALQAETGRFLSSYGLDLDTFPALLMIFLLKLWWDGDKAVLVNQAFRHLRQPR